MSKNPSSFWGSLIGHGSMCLFKNEILVKYTNFLAMLTWERIMYIWDRDVYSYKNDFKCLTFPPKWRNITKGRALNV